MHLDDLEQALADRAGPEPPDGLRGRVLAAAAAARQAPPPPPWGAAWRLAAAVALAANAALCAANAARYSAAAAPPAAASAAMGNRFDSLAADALAGVRPAPDAAAVARGFFAQQEE